MTVREIVKEAVSNL